MKVTGLGLVVIALILVLIFYMFVPSYYEEKCDRKYTAEGKKYIEKLVQELSELERRVEEEVKADVKIIRQELIKIYDQVKALKEDDEALHSAINNAEDMVNNLLDRIRTAIADPDTEKHYASTPSLIDSEDWRLKPKKDYAMRGTYKNNDGDIFFMCSGGKNDQPTKYSKKLADQYCGSVFGNGSDCNLYQGVCNVKDST